MGFIVHILITALFLLFVARLVPGIQVAGGGAALVAALALGVINAVIRPILFFLTLPVTVLTLGLFLLVLNALMLMLAASIVPDFRVSGFGAAFIGALILTVLNGLVALIF